MYHTYLFFGVSSLTGYYKMLSRVPPLCYTVGPCWWVGCISANTGSCLDWLVDFHFWYKCLCLARLAGLFGTVGSHSTSLGGGPCTWLADLRAGKPPGAQGLQRGHWPQSSDVFSSASGCGLLPGILFQNNRGYFCNKISLPGGGRYDSYQWPSQSPEFLSPISDTTIRKLGLASQVSLWADPPAGRPRVWRRKRLGACAHMPPPSCWI